MGEIFRTKGQLAMGESFNFALKNSCKVAILDNPGSGFKFALKYFMGISNNVKTVYADVQRETNIREISVQMFKELMHIKFSNLNYKRVRLHDLVRVLGNRVKQDLKGKGILLVFDNVDKLSVTKLEVFIKMISAVNFKCGIILRTSQRHFAKIKMDDERLYATFLEITERKVIPQNTENDLRMLCSAYQLTDPDIVEEISTKTKNFRIAMTYITRYSHLRKNALVNQLELNFNIV